MSYCYIYGVLRANISTMQHVLLTLHKSQSPSVPGQTSPTFHRHHLTQFTIQKVEPSLQIVLLLPTNKRYEQVHQNNSVNGLQHQYDVSL